MAPLQGGIGPNGEDTTMNEKKNIGFIFFVFNLVRLKILVKIPIKMIHEGQKKQFFGQRKFSKFLLKKNILGKLGGALGIY
jgi:hypothetical protein